MATLHKKIINRLTHEGNKVGNKFSEIRFKKTMSNNIIKVFFDNFTDKVSYRNLIQELPYNMRPWVDQAIR